MLMSSKDAPTSMTSLTAYRNDCSIYRNPSYFHNLLPSPGSRILLDRYVSQLSKDLGSTSKPSNPYIRYVIPLSLSDKLYMNCVLALSGSDLGCQATVAPSTMSATWSHYLHAVRGLHYQLSNHRSGDIQQALHLLFHTLGLMHVEVSEGSSPYLSTPDLSASV